MLVEVKVRDRIAVVISEIIGRSGCHFLARSCGDIVLARSRWCAIGNGRTLECE